ncbi:MAG TPA: hypothetical protein VGC89_18990 [Pyrinomonadaceae bacterium]
MKKIALMTYALALLVALAAAPLVARADVQDRLFDFTDAYYQQNGVNPAAIVNRINGLPPRAIFDNPIFAFQRNVRAIRLNPAYNQSGALTFWTVMGDLFVDSFTNDAAGQRARQIADNMVLYVFPTRTGNPIGLGNNRQADIVDMRNGYFSNNPLGLWLHVWVSYTDRAFNTSDGKKALNDLAKKNGLALDGTPIIKSLSDLDNLFSKGFAVKRFRNPNGSEGPMYGICPVVKDPTNGGIAPDTALAFVRNPDGTPLEPAFVLNFDSLKNTGNWAR